MPSWKKVLVSGSNIEVNEITASSVPGGGGAEQLLALDSASGGFVVLSQGSVSGESPIFPIHGLSSASNPSNPSFVAVDSSTNFDSGTEYMLFSTSFDHGFGFNVSETNDTASITLTTPQDLSISGSPTFSNLTIDNKIVAKDGSGTYIHFPSASDDKLEVFLHSKNFMEFEDLASGTSSIVINQDHHKLNFNVEGDTIANLLHIDGVNDRVGIGTSDLSTYNIFNVNGGVRINGGLTASLNTNTTSTDIAVITAVGGFEQRNINVLLDSASANLSSSIIGTTNEVDIDFATSPGDTKIGLVDNVVISTLSASAVTASELRVDNDIALGGNLFSFTGTSFIENVSAVFTASNIFGSGSGPEGNTHEFTGSVSVTGSDFALNNVPTLTATATSASFAYISTAVGSIGSISASGNLYASSSEAMPSDVVVTYDTSSGQFHYTASSGIGITAYPDLSDIPVGIVSSSAFNSTNQGELSATINLSSSLVDLGLMEDDSPTFAGLGISGNSQISGSLTVDGQISGSSHLFASLSMDTTASAGPITDGVVVYDTDTGKFFFTGSYGGGDASFSTAGTNIVSESAFNSPSQGQFTASINGSSSLVDLGLERTDSPTFNNIRISGNASVFGDLTVAGTTTAINSTHLTVEDNFILLASGSATDGTPSDGGIIVERANTGDGSTTATTGTALFWDDATQNWSIDKAGASPANNTATVDVKVATIVTAGNSGNTPPTSSAVMGFADGDDEGTRMGHFYVDTDDEYGIYVYTGIVT